MWCMQDLSSTPEMEPNSLAVEAQNLTTGWWGKSPCIALIIKPKHLVVAYNVLSDLCPSPTSSFAPSVQVFSNSSILHSISTTQMHFPFLASASSGRGFFLNFFPGWVTNVTQILTPMSHHHRDPVTTKFPPSFPIISSAFHSTFNTISLSISVSWSYKNVSWRKEKNVVNTQSIVIWFMNK